jgi:PAS domain S-box-containing protein
MLFELTHLIDALPGMAWTALPDGRAEFFNRRWLDYTGLTVEQAADLGWIDAVHPDDRERVGDDWRSCVISGLAGDTEARLRRHDGAYRWFLFRANPVPDATGNISRWFGTNIDIEDRRRSEEVLQSNERSLRLIINTIPTHIYVLNTEGFVQYVNQAVMDYTGLSMEDVHQEDYRDRVIHPEDFKRVGAPRAAGLRCGQPFSTEQRVLGNDGQYRWFLVRYEPLLDEQGRIVRWYVAAFDIEDRKRAEEELHNARATLAHMSRVMTMGELTASIAHEVSQPLSGIITNANTCLRMLAAGQPNLEGACETARRTIRDANRAADVIERLRALFSKTDIAADPVDLTEATREVIALCSSDLLRKGTLLRPEFAGDLPVVVGDRIQLQQVILNLLTNAADAMLAVDDRPREIHIKTELDADDLVRVTVRDSGVGFDSRDADKLFGAFFSTKPQGMGIGLSVSRSIIESHHGRIWAVKNEGPGATFAFAIPRSLAST